MGNPSRERSVWYKCDDCDEWFFGADEYGGHRSNCVHDSQNSDMSDEERESLDQIADKYFGDG